jgi:hypothetical protein
MSELTIYDFEQGSAEWHQARCGVVTASRFKDVLAEGDGKMRGKYLRELASETIRGWVEDGYSNEHMARGQEQEDDARRAFAFEHAIEPIRVGFIRRGRVGCSPDSLIGDDGGLEIKSALGHIQIDRLQRGRLPPEHVAQVQGSLWMTGRKWWSFVSYSPDLPLMHVRVERDEEYIARLAKAVTAFTEELDALVSSLGGSKQFRSAA